MNRLILIILIFVSISLQAQQFELADTYFEKAEYEKAITEYEKLLKNDENLTIVYDKYLVALSKTKKYTEKEKFLKKLQKSYPSNYIYKVDYANCLVELNKKDESDKLIAKLIQDVKSSNVESEALLEVFIKRRNLAAAVDLVSSTRKATKNSNLFSLQLAEVYRYSGKIDLMTSEYLNFLNAVPQEIEYVQQAIVTTYSKDEHYEDLITKLYKEIPNDSRGVFAKMLAWYYIQQRDFNNAFIQERSLDKKFSLRGSNVFDLGKIAFENKEYDACIDIFKYLSEQYAKDPRYTEYKKWLIKSKEERIKTIYPIREEEINELISTYKSLEKQSNNYDEKAEINRNVALLYAFYKHNIDSAKSILTKIIAQPRIQRNLLAQSKIDLGDIYLLSGEPWESALLYYQVEKSHKDEPIGHEAKLKNAKLSYFRADFELAQAHLDVLKLATTREIANDAMHLSLLIQDNLALDTTTVPLERYANAELLIFQNKYDEALRELTKMEKDYKKHSLIDEIYFLKTKVYLKIRDYENAIVNLKKILASHADDILSDDACFELAKIYDYNLKQNDLAMQYYKQMLIQFPGSIYTEEARKRYRFLRGDQLN